MQKKQKVKNVKKWNENKPQNDGIVQVVDEWHTVQLTEIVYSTNL